jgi:hypothetical protein
MRAMGDALVAERSRHVLVPARQLEDLVFMAEAAAMAIETGSPHCPELVDGLRGSVAAIRTMGVLEPH